MQKESEHKYSEIFSYTKRNNQYSNQALIMAVLEYIKGDKQNIWQKIEGMRYPTLQKEDPHILLNDVF